MNRNNPEIVAQIRSLCDHQRLCVLSTQQDSQPYASLVGFAATPDLKQIVFLTPETTRKFENLSANPRVALLIHNAENQAGDFFDAAAVTATGVTSIPQGDQQEALLSLFLARHPHLSDFSRNPTTALVAVRVNRYFLVSRFQDVVELEMD